MTDVVERVPTDGRSSDAERDAEMDAAAAYELRLAAEAEQAQFRADEETARQAALAEEERIAVFLDEMEAMEDAIAAAGTPPSLTQPDAAVWLTGNLA